MGVGHNSEESRLLEMLRSKSVRFGHFKLASGKESNVYVDCKLTTYSAQAIPLVGRAFLRRIEAKGWAPQAVGGLTLGADPIAFAIARASLETERPINAFIVRKEAKKHGMGRFIEGMEETQGCRVVILDDVCTTGDSTALAIEKAKDAGMEVLGAICLVDREAGATELLKSKFGCSLDSVFKLSDFQATKNESGPSPRVVESAV